MSWSKLGAKLDAHRNARTRRILREQFATSNLTPVVETPEADKPTLVGVSGGWYTGGGDRISYPSAYSRKGWSNMIYRCSTEQILVPVGTLIPGCE